MVMYLCVPVAEASPSLRCNGLLVSRGESPASLLQKCGEPLHRQAVCLVMPQVGWILTPYSPGAPSAVLTAHCVPMEEWTYDRGPGAFFGIVRIHNGSVESMRDGERVR